MSQSIDVMITIDGPRLGIDLGPPPDMASVLNITLTDTVKTYIDQISIHHSSSRTIKIAERPCDMA